MQKPHALIRRHSIRAPHKIILRHHDAKALLRAGNEIVCSRKDFLLGFVCIAKYRGMCCLAVSGDARKIFPVRNIRRRTRLLIRGFARGDSKFRTSKELFITCIIALIGACRNVRGVCRKMIAHIRSTPSVSLLCCIQARGCISCIKRLVHARGERHDARKIKSGFGTFTDNVKLGIILCRHHVAREAERGKLVVNATVTCLHGKHPVQIPLDFGEQIRQAAFGRNAPFSRLEEFREVFIKRKERVGSNARIHNVATVIAGIVPALARIDGARRSGRIVELGRCIRVARGTRPFASILAFKSHRCALVIEPLDGRLVNVGKSVVLDHQILAERLTAHLDGVLAFSRQLGEIYQLHILAAGIPERSCSRRHRKHGFARSILNLDVAGTTDKRKFLGVRRAITHLVNESVSGKSRRHQNGRRNCGKSHSLETHNIPHSIKRDTNARTRVI